MRSCFRRLVRLWEGKDVMYRPDRKGLTRSRGTLWCEAIALGHVVLETERQRNRRGTIISEWQCLVKRNEQDHFEPALLNQETPWRT